MCCWKWRRSSFHILLYSASASNKHKCLQLKSSMLKCLGFSNRPQRSTAGVNILFCPGLYKCIAEGTMQIVFTEFIISCWNSKEKKVIDLNQRIQMISCPQSCQMLGVIDFFSSLLLTQQIWSCHGHHQLID